MTVAALFDAPVATVAGVSHRYGKVLSLIHI